MDTNGIIVASNDLIRIGDYHEAAHICAKEGKIITLSNDNISDFEGSKLGINLPLNYEGNVVGVVGISGSPKEVTSYGLIVKELVDYILTDNVVKTYDEMHLDAVKLFFFELFKEKIGFDSASYYQKVRDLSIDYKDQYIIIGKLSMEGNQSIEETITQKSLNDIREYLRENLGYCFLMYTNQVLVVSRDIINLKKKLSSLINEIYLMTNVKIRFIYSEKCKIIEDYPIQYRLLKRMSEFKYIYQSNKMVYSVRECEELFLIENLDDAYITEYLLFYNDVFLNEKESASKVILDTIRCYFEMDMNITDTADALYVHRNTVKYRLNKFKDDYDIDIYKPMTCMKIYLGILCIENTRSLENLIKN